MSKPDDKYPPQTGCGQAMEGPLDMAARGNKMLLLFYSLSGSSERPQVLKCVFRDVRGQKRGLLFRCYISNKVLIVLNGFNSPMLCIEMGQGLTRLDTSRPDIGIAPR
ncbi:hypothetical protein ED312_09730 [Sinomicrobium pectinilyticum]|uniref:Uncharacterized protein n=1 Tax=Sinomicrobium pectinilyticum TaxID=1084421 RepID=A0A3N0EJD7_SINP1|nr:hypothetical protein ED312_09730 [Sinomicrobium pectinilyticum]